MATDLNALVSQLKIETGGTLTTSTLLDLLVNGVGLYNADGPQSFAVTGTLLDRDATDLEKRAIVLFAAVGYLGQRAVAESENAIVHSNVAGRTDLGGVEWALSKRRKEILDDQLGPLMERLKSVAVCGDVYAAEIGESLDEITKVRVSP